MGSGTGSSGKVSVGGLPVDSDVQANILPPLEKDVQEWEHSILLYLNSEWDGGSHTVEVIQKSYCRVLLHNATDVFNMRCRDESVIPSSLSCTPATRLPAGYQSQQQRGRMPVPS